MSDTERPQAPQESPVEGSVEVTRDDVIQDPKKFVDILDKRKAEAESLRTRLRDAEAQLEKVQEANKTEMEKMLDKARKEGAESAASEYTSLLIAERVKNRAAGVLNDPEDAVRLLDASAVHPR